MKKNLIWSFIAYDEFNMGSVDHGTSTQSTSQSRDDPRDFRWNQQ